MLFMTKLGMAKLVDTSEFEVSKRTVAATKLQEEDLLVGIYVTDAVKEVFQDFHWTGSQGRGNDCQQPARHRTDGRRLL